MGKGIFPVEDDPRLRTSDADARLRNHSVSVSTAGSTWNLGVQPQGLVVMCRGLLSFETFSSVSSRQSPQSLLHTPDYSNVFGIDR